MTDSAGTYQTTEFNIAPGQERQIHVSGRFVRILEANHDDVGLMIDAGAEMRFAEGITVKMRPGEHFERITLRNDSATTPLIGVLAFGQGDIDDSRFSLVGDTLPVRSMPGTVFESHSDTIAASGSASASLGLDVDPARRKAHITNHSTVDVRVVASGDWGPVIGPDETFTVEGGAALQVINKSGANAFVSTLLEKWS